MASQTPRFGFTTFDSVNDTFNTRGWKFPGADRIRMDQILAYAAELHQHTGESSAPPEAVASPPTLVPGPLDGTFPANRAIYYRTALVDTRGQEHAASQTAVVYTAPPVLRPEPFLTAPSPGVGTLEPGIYVYALSAYTWENRSETPLSAQATGRLDAIGGFALFLPPTPSGATGFNVYRKGPTDAELYWVGTAPATTVTGEVWNDTGLKIDRLRTVPTSNTTSNTNSVSVAPASPVPAGFTLKIYRTLTPTNWDRSLLVWTAVTPFRDTGHATQNGSPPGANAAIKSPPKINLATDAQGRPPAGLTPTTFVANFSFPGPVTTGSSVWQWLDEFDDARVLAFRANLGRGSTPAVRPVRVVLDRRAAGTVLWHRYQNPDTLVDLVAEIPVGQTTSPTVPVPFGAQPGTHLTRGMALRPTVLQSGGGVTPTDSDLAFTVTLAVRHGSATQTYTWET